MGITAQAKLPPAAVLEPCGVPPPSRKSFDERAARPLPDDVRTGLAERGQDAYALVFVAAGSDPAGWPEAEAPRVGETGIARTGADLTRITLQELTRGRPETLRRRLQLDNGTGRLAIISAEGDGLDLLIPGRPAFAAECFRCRRCTPGRTQSAAVRPKHADATPVPE
ncbi:hypothetical protein ACH4D4_08860 [Streptomyces pristinaespiralis]|uniref:hypothetical protein n=1 Tax=Streptomyces pristinaespiralis TaxID=38300 RepID=UPI0037BD3139